MRSIINELKAMDIQLTDKRERGEKLCFAMTIMLIVLGAWIL